MAKEYIGSQEYFEDGVNAYYDQKEKMERDMQKQYEKDVIKQMERDFYAQQTQHLEPTEEIAELIEAAERKAFQDCTAIIKKKLSDLINKREMLANAYNEMMADIPNCPNQFNSHEYKVVDRQCELLYEILRRIEEESK